MGNPAVAKASVFISFQPSPRFVDGIVRWLADFCHLTLEDLEVVARMQMAVNELVENVVKYGTSPNVGIEVELERGDEGSVLRLRTRNTATPERLEVAVRLLAEIRDARDPIALYDRLVLHSASREGVSGLGLARIRAEGELDIDYAVNGDELCVTVEAKLTSEGTK
jgi:hypothetical protein